MSSDLVGTLIKPAAAAMGSKLGRCASCMRVSVRLMLGSLLLLAALAMAGAGPALMLAIAVPAAAFTAWSVAHGVAYVLRGPERASGCRSCAEKARARRRAQRWQRMRVWLGGAPAALPRRGAVRRKPAPARTPAKRLEDMVAAPPAEEGLRYVAERSPEYLALLPRLASLEPADSWQADGLHHFLYQLHPEEQGRMLHALFITRRGDDAPLVATLVTTDPDGRLMGTVNLRAAAPKG